MCTLIGTAKLNGLDPDAYLRCALERIASPPDHPHQRLAALECRSGRRRRTIRSRLTHSPCMSTQLLCGHTASRLKHTHTGQLMQPYSLGYRVPGSVQGAFAPAKRRSPPHPVVRETREASVQIRQLSAITRWLHGCGSGSGCPHAQLRFENKRLREIERPWPCQAI